MGIFILKLCKKFLDGGKITSRHLNIEYLNTEYLNIEYLMSWNVSIHWKYIPDTRFAVFYLPFSHHIWRASMRLKIDLKWHSQELATAFQLPFCFSFIFPAKLSRSWLLQGCMFNYPDLPCWKPSWAFPMKSLSISFMHDNEVKDNPKNILACCHKLPLTGSLTSTEQSYGSSSKKGWKNTH